VKDRSSIGGYGALGFACKPGGVAVIFEARLAARNIGGTAAHGAFDAEIVSDRRCASFSLVRAKILGAIGHDTNSIHVQRRVNAG
jgi:hypothetical protein